MVVALSVSAKGCNDSDNETVQAALNNGCSAEKTEHHGWTFTCPKKE